MSHAILKWAMNWQAVIWCNAEVIQQKRYSIVNAAATEQLRKYETRCRILRIAARLLHHRDFATDKEIGVLKLAPSPRNRWPRLSADRLCQVSSCDSKITFAVRSSEPRLGLWVESVGVFGKLDRWKIASKGGCNPPNTVGELTFSILGLLHWALPQCATFPTISSKLIKTNGQPFQLLAY